jgi:hypothetical protein
MIQELLDWSDVKKFYIRTEIGRNGQAAGPQHQPSWSHVIAESSGMTRQRASKLVSIARVVPARVVCQVMSTSDETDATLDRLRMAIKNGVAPERALDQVRSKANGKTKGRVSGPPSVQKVADGLEAMAPDARATYLRQLRGDLSAETYRIARTAFGLRGHRGPGRQGPSATARDRVRVSRRLAHLFDRSDLAVTMNDVARLADVGEASVNELYNQDNRTGKRQHILDSIDRVLDRLGIPDEQPT